MKQHKSYDLWNSGYYWVGDTERKAVLGRPLLQEMFCILIWVIVKRALTYVRVTELDTSDLSKHHA